MSFSPYTLRLIRILIESLPIRPRAALARSRLTNVPAVRDVALDTAGANIYCSGIARVPV